MIALLHLQLVLWSRRVGGQLAITASLLLPWLFFLPLALAKRASGVDLVGNARVLAFAGVVGFGAPALANLVARSLHDGQRRRQAMLERTSGLGGIDVVGSHLAAGAVMALPMALAAHALPLLLRPDRVCAESLAAAAIALGFVAPVAVPVAFLLPRMASLVLLTLAAPPGVMFALLAIGTDSASLDDFRTQPWDDNLRLLPLLLAVLAANAACLLLVSPAWSRWASRRGF